MAASALLAESLAADRLEEISARGVLRWGADAEGGAPFVYPDPDDPGRLVGFEWDLAKALAARLGVRAEMVQNQWDQLIPALARGNFDIILNGLELTPENRERVAMSRPYYVYGQQIVTRPADSGLDTLERLKGKTVGVLSGSAAERLVKNAPGVLWKSYPGNVESFQDLKVNRLDAALVDSPIAVHYIAPDPSLSLAGRPFAHGYYAIGLLPEDEKLLAALNDAIKHLATDGTLGRIYRQYGIWDDAQTQLAEFQDDDAAQLVSARRPGWRQRLGYLPLLLRAAVMTVQLSILGMGLAVVGGLGVALVRLYGPAPLSWLAKTYIEVFRGTPLLIQLFLIYYGLPEIGIRLDAFVAAVLGLGLNYAANEAENYRAGIQSVPHGQTEAALALGMTRGQTLRYVVLPQAARVAIPPVTNDFIAMFKDTSIVSVITMVELTKQYGMLAASNSDYIVVGLMTAGIYFGLSYPASILAGRLEAKLRHDHR